MIWLLIFLVVVQQFRIWNLQAWEQTWIDQYQRLLKSHIDAMYGAQEKIKR
jgi:hypothetical protein